jgi:hypothetical protein
MRRRWLGVSAALSLRRPARRTPSRSRETPPDQHNPLAAQTECVLPADLPSVGPSSQQSDAGSVHATWLPAVRSTLTTWSTTT